MKYYVLSLLFFSFSYLSAQDFKSGQKKYARYRSALSNVEAAVDQLLLSKELKKEQLQLFIRILKSEQVLEVWGKNQTKESFKLIKSYPFCYASGSMGPKRKQGDGQVPEGVYFIDRFNPWSSYHLSLGINYPNTVDRILGRKPLGGDIFIHGDCVSIGCVAITDQLIEEVYYLTVEARNNGQHKIPVHIFPFKMTKENLVKQIQRYPNHKSFWQNLQPVYLDFENQRKISVIKQNSEGKYTITNNH